MEKFNILCMVTDQHRADHLGCYGNKDVKTPNLDRLASEGLVFTKSYVANPVCSPNRASMFTGQYPKAHGLRENGNTLELDAVTLPQTLKENGYQTFSSGKLHLAPYLIEPDHPGPDHFKAESKLMWNAQNAPFKTPYHGLDKVYYVGGHGHYNFGQHRNELKAQSPTIADGYLRDNALIESYLDEEVWCSNVPDEMHYNTKIADKTIEFINSRDPNKPFFVWCSFPDPHHPFSPPEPWYSMYTGDSITLNPAGDEGDDGMPETLKAFRQKMKLVDGTLGEITAKNYGMISMVDHNIGRVIQHLKDNGLYENTIIVFFSDHGDYMGDHGLMRKGIMPYEGLYRIPTIYRIPERSRATGQTNALHSTVDIMPTLLELTGTKIPASVQGISQAPVLCDQQKTVRQTAYAELDDTPTAQRVRFLRNSQYAFAYFFGCDHGLLYDMENDPSQQNNLFYKPEYEKVKNDFFKKLATESINAETWLPEKICHA